MDEDECYTALMIARDWGYRPPRCMKVGIAKKNGENSPAFLRGYWWVVLLRDTRNESNHRKVANGESHIRHHNTLITKSLNGDYLRGDAQMGYEQRL